MRASAEPSREMPSRERGPTVLVLRQQQRGWDVRGMAPRSITLGRETGTAPLTFARQGRLEVGAKLLLVRDPLDAEDDVAVRLVP